jgi:hypothetical protein
MRFVGPGTLQNQLSDDVGIDVVSTEPVHVAVIVVKPGRNPFSVHELGSSRAEDPGQVAQRH